MTFALWSCRAFLAIVFAVSGVAKLADRNGTKKALGDFGVPLALTTAAGVLLPLVELLTAAALLWNATAWWGALAAAALLALFTLVIAANILRGRTPDCHCFGQLAAQPISAKTIARNVVLLLPALFVMFGREWLATIRPMEAMLVILSAGLAIALAAIWRLSIRQRRLTESVRVMEQLFDASDAATHRHALSSAATTTPAGLPVGVVAPDFALATTSGASLTLTALLGRGKPVIAWFGSATCGPCKELLPEIATWRARLGDRYEVAGFLRGTAAENALIVKSHPELEVAFIGDSGVAEAYRTTWTPGAVVISAEGRIASETAFGLDAIRKLIANTAELEPLVANRVVPDFRAIAADGREVVSGELLADAPTAIMFWSATCPYCTAIVDDLERWAGDRPPRAPNLVLVQSNSDRLPPRTFGVPVVLDADGSLSRELGSAGTPSAILVDRTGAIVSPVLAGGDNIRALLGIQAGAG